MDTDCSKLGLAILAILQLRGVGNRQGLRIIRALPEPLADGADLCDLLDDVCSRIPRLRTFSRGEVEAAQAKAREILEFTQANGIEIATLGSADMPSQLSSIPDPPLVLYLRGNPNSLSGNAPIAVVGTREASDFGRQTAERFGRQIAEQGHTVVSGLAVGCDTAAHRGCLAGDGRTVAVLAHGLHMTYPAANRALAEEIVERGGCLLTEYAWGTRPSHGSFVERDRIQSGLSYGVLVVETSENGGTMHTARHCLAQGRLLACLVHPEQERNQAVAGGNRMLLKQEGAVQINEEADLTGFLGQVSARYVTAK